METYNKAARASSRVLTRTFSDSFSLAARLFPKSIRQDIYAIYGLVRLADEVADTYKGPDALAQLIALEDELAAVMKRGFSTNMAVHAFGLAARQAGIDKTLTEPFFHSMRTDIRNDYDPSMYGEYIHGSAEVVGLMCLRVFCGKDMTAYAHLEPGAKALGSSFQKVNFLRDIAADHDRLGRYYFPNGSYDGFSEDDKKLIIEDIHKQFAESLPAIRQLPRDVRPAVLTAYKYYLELIRKIEQTPAEQLKHRRIRITRRRKLAILSGTVIRERLRG